MPKTRTKRRYYRKSKSLAKRVAKIESTFKPEKKWTVLDYTGASSVAPAYDGPTDDTLYLVPQGTSQHERVGHSIKATSWYGKMLVRWDTGDVNALYRMVMYIPRNADDDLSNHGGAGVALSTIGQIDADRFTVLSDRSFTMSAPNSGSNSYKTLLFKKKFRRPINIQFDGSTSTSTVRHPIRLYITSTAATSQARPNIEGYIKCYYIDP